MARRAPRFDAWLTIVFALLGVFGAIVKVYYDFKRGMARAKVQAAEYRARRDALLAQEAGLAEMNDGRVA